MRKFIYKILKTVTLVYLILFVLQFAIDTLLGQENACNNNTWHKIFNGTLESDIVILGNSRAEAHYDTEIIANITNKKTYNLGQSGTPINILNIRWQSYINRNKLPEVLILDLDYTVLGTTNTIFEKFQYLPYIYKEEYINSASKIDTDNLLERYLPLYKYRGYETEIYKNIKGLSNTELCSNSVNGYIEHDKQWDNAAWESFKTKMKKDKENNNKNFEMYAEGITHLKAIIAFCKTNNIKVYFVWSPQYYEAYSYRLEYRKYLDSVLNKLSLKNNITYLNLSKDTLSFDKNNFYDKSHLNSKGARLFSEKVAEALQSDLIK